MADVRVPVASLKELRKILKQYGVSTKEWGKSEGTKSLKVLWGQVKKGDCILVNRNGVLIRIVWRSQAFIFTKHQGKAEVLMEIAVYKGGIQVSSSRLVSVGEKYNHVSGETDDIGMVRGMEEELKIPDFPLNLFRKLGVAPPAYTASCRSFPTLASESNISYYVIDDLPPQYWHDQYEEPTRTKTNVFRWDDGERVAQARRAIKKIQKEIQKRAA